MGMIWLWSLALAPADLDARVVKQLAELSGRTLARFQIGEVLGKGQSSLVSRATDADSGQAVALEVMQPAFSKDDGGGGCQGTAGQPGNHRKRRAGSLSAFHRQDVGAGRAVVGNVRGVSGSLRNLVEAEQLFLKGHVNPFELMRPAQELAPPEDKKVLYELALTDARRSNKADKLNGLTTRRIEPELAAVPAVVVQLPLPAGPLLVAVPLEDVRAMETVAVN